MKFVKLFLLSIFLSVGALADPVGYDMYAYQLNSDATDSWFDWIVRAPKTTAAGDTDGLVWFSTTDHKYHGLVDVQSAIVVNSTDWTFGIDPGALDIQIADVAGLATALATKANTSSLALVATSGAYADLSGKPSLATVATTGAYADLTGKPSLATVATSGSYNDLSDKPTIGTGSVTNVTAGAGLSGGSITSTGTISMPNTGTSGTYSGVTTDAQGRITAGTTRNFAAPSRSLVTTTSSTGYQISSTRDAMVGYEGTFQTTSTIGGPSSVTVFLETADTNSTTPGDWTIIAQQVNSNTITLAIVLQQVDVDSWSFSRIIPAGKYVRIRYGSVTGTATATINAQQQEVQL